ncbi:hydrophobin family protein [Streptomyces sp. NPDC015220]|uniref:hydrophobin family protein n=1 Tax=Streptomyces sp. NPDC015220 TaxID=3364947 RepID=UPI0036F9B5C8
MTKTARFTAGLASTVLALAASLTWCSTASAAETDPVHCESVQQASSPAATALTGLLGVVLSDHDALVGFGCAPAGNGDADVDFCRTTTVDPGGVLSLGRLPDGHTCP